MVKKKMTVTDFRKFKREGRKFAYVTGYDYTMATILDESDIEVILVGDSLGTVMLGHRDSTPVTVDDMIHHIKPVVKGAPNTFIVGDMPFGSYEISVEKAVENAFRIYKEGGCDCIKLEGGAKMAATIKAIVEAGLPVMAHIGLSPQHAGAIGGFKRQGTTPEGARKVLEDGKAVEAAGAFSTVLESVPSGVAKVLTETLSIPVMGIGAGPYVDCQILITQDLLGMYPGFEAKFVKRYANMRKQMIDALNEFHRESISGEFPSEEYSYNKEIEGFEIK